MGAYSVRHSLAAAASKPHILLDQGGDVLIELFDIILGCKDSPADNVFEFDIFRTTAAGTGGTGLTETAVGNYAPTPGAAGLGGTFSADPTNTGVSVLPLIFNQRATLRHPMQPAHPIRNKVAANNGLSLYMTSVGAASNIVAGEQWREG